MIVPATKSISVTVPFVPLSKTTKLEVSTKPKSAVSLSFTNGKITKGVSSVVLVVSLLTIIVSLTASIVKYT